MKTTRKWTIVIVGAVCIAVMAPVALLPVRAPWNHPTHARVEPAMHGTQLPGTEAPADQNVAPASHAHNPPGDVADSQVMDEMVDDVADEVLQAVRPIAWHRKEFDGHAENFSPEDLEAARALTQRYFDNFSRIETLAFTVMRKRESLTSTQFTKWFFEPKRSAQHDYSMTVQMARSPVYMKMEGTFGNGEAFREIVTPAGEISSGHFGQGASWIPHWMDGERLFLERVVLRYGNSVKKDVRMDYELPAAVSKHLDLAGYRDNRYDVIEVVQEDIQTVRSLWFNRQTGMLDFSLSTRQSAQKGENPFFDFCAVTYDQINGIYYPVASLGLDNNCTTKEEVRVSNLRINGTQW